MTPGYRSILSGAALRTAGTQTNEAYMTILLASALFALLNQSTAPAVLQRTFVAPDAGKILYGISIPAGYNAREPRPLVLALHPGGGRTPYYGL